MGKRLVASRITARVAATRGRRARAPGLGASQRQLPAAAADFPRARRSALWHGLLVGAGSPAGAGASCCRAGPSASACTSSAHAATAYCRRGHGSVARTGYLDLDPRAVTRIPCPLDHPAGGVRAARRLRPARRGHLRQARGRCAAGAGRSPMSVAGPFGQPRRASSLLAVALPGSAQRTTRRSSTWPAGLAGAGAVPGDRRRTQPAAVPGARRVRRPAPVPADLAPPCRVEQVGAGRLPRAVPPDLADAARQRADPRSAPTSRWPSASTSRPIALRLRHDAPVLRLRRCHQAGGASTRCVLEGRYFRPGRFVYFEAGASSTSTLSLLLLSRGLFVGLGLGGLGRHDLLLDASACALTGGWRRLGAPAPGPAAGGGAIRAADGERCCRRSPGPARRPAATSAASMAGDARPRVSEAFRAHERLTS